MFGLAGGTAVLLIVAGPVRLLVERRVTRLVASSYAAYQGYEEERSELSAQLDAVAVPDDQADVDRALASLDREEAARLGDLAAGLRYPLAIDPGSWTLTRAMRRALVARASDLTHQASWLVARPAGQLQPPDPSASSNVVVDRALALLDGRMRAAGLLVDRLRAAGLGLPNDAPRPLHAADATLARLRRWTDQQTGAVLALADGAHLWRLDVDRSTATTWDVAGSLGTSFLVGRAGWIAARSGNQVIAVPAGPAPYGLAGMVSAMFAADQPDAIWVLVGDQLAEIDQHGDPLSPTWNVPGDVQITPGQVKGGFVVATSVGKLQAWMPATGRRQPITAGPAVLLATYDDTVVWEPAPESVDTSVLPVHVTDLDTGRDVIVSGRLDVGFPRSATTAPWMTTPCEFSPDGNLIVCSDLTRGIAGTPGATYQLVVINPASGAPTLIGGAGSDQPQEPMVWTSDSRRLFVGVTAAEETYIATWTAGAKVASDLRYRPTGPDWPFGLAIVSDGGGTGADSG